MESDQRRYELREEVRDFLAPHGFLEPEQITEIISIVMKHLNDWLRDTEEVAHDIANESDDPLGQEFATGQVIGLATARGIAETLAQAPARRIRKVLNAH